MGEPEPSRPAGRGRRDARSVLVAALVLFLGLLVAAACGSGGAENAPAAAGDEAEADQTYTVRGEVVALPRAGARNPEIRIRHETVPDFMAYDGEVVGMASMTMPFPLAPELELGDLARGDVIELVLEVSWDASPPYRITRIEELPPGTALDFSSEEPLPGGASLDEGVGSSPP